MDMGTDDYAAAYLAAETALNTGDVEPFQALLADPMNWMGEDKSPAQAVAAFRELLGRGWRFQTSGLTGFGPFLIDYGWSSLPDGTRWRAAGVLRFNAEGRVDQWSGLAESPSAG